MKTLRIWDETGEPRNVKCDSFTVSKKKILTLRTAGSKPETVAADKWVGIVDVSANVVLK